MKGLLFIFRSYTIDFTSRTTKRLIIGCNCAVYIDIYQAFILKKIFSGIVVEHYLPVKLR